MPDEKRVFAKLPPDQVNRFIAQARIAGTTGQDLIKNFVTEYLKGAKGVEIRDENRIESLIHRGGPVVENLLTAAITAAEEIVNHAESAIVPCAEQGHHDIAGAIGDAARVAAKARRVASAGEQNSGADHARPADRNASRGR